MRSRNIFVDLDCVLADFDKRAGEIIGRPWVKDDDKAWQNIVSNHETFFLELDLMPDAMELWNFIEKYSPKILTAIPNHGKLLNATEHKRQWVAEKLGTEVEFRTGPYASQKQDHCKPGDILIDDNVFNIAQWGNKGGIGIFHKDAKTSIKALKKLVPYGLTL